MNKWILNTIGISLILAIGVFGWALIQVGLAGKGLSASLHSLDGLSTTITSVNNTLTQINKSCAPGPCGTLANVNKTIVKIGDIAVTTQRQVAQTNTLIVATANSLSSVSSHVNKVADQATTDLATTNEIIAGLKPIEQHTDEAVENVNDILKDNAIHQTIDNLGTFTASLTGTTQNIQGITGDGKRVADDLTTKYFTPQPLWKKILTNSESGVKLGTELGCLFTHSC
jgi:methyl-accepting chemotaxis protein